MDAMQMDDDEWEQQMDATAERVPTSATEKMVDECCAMPLPRYARCAMRRIDLVAPRERVDFWWI